METNHDELVSSFCGITGSPPLPLHPLAKHPSQYHKMAGYDNGLADSMTIPSDSENYDAQHDSDSHEHEDSSYGSPAMILYSPPTIWGLLRGAGINLLLPFVNGLMLGFGELFANELAFRFGWSGTKVCIDFSFLFCFLNSPILPVRHHHLCLQAKTDLNQIFPNHRSSRRVGPGVEMKEDPVERRRRDGQELDAYTSLE